MSKNFQNQQKVIKQEKQNQKGKGKGKGKGGFKQPDPKPKTQTRYIYLEGDKKFKQELHVLVPKENSQVGPQLVAEEAPVTPSISQFTCYVASVNHLIDLELRRHGLNFKDDFIEMIEIYKEYKELEKADGEKQPAGAN